MPSSLVTMRCNLRPLWLVALVMLSVSGGGKAFQPLRDIPFQRRIEPLLSATKDEAVVSENVDAETKPCFYQTPGGWWTPRINIKDLRVGQKLNGTVVQQLLNAKTGPKLFFECGIGRIDSNGDWQIVNGMLRFYSRRTKKSVVRKKAEKLRKKSQVELFVSRVELENGRFEVCTTMEAVENFVEQHQPRIPASTLAPKQEIVGTVVNVLPYGVMVDVGANRNGLLHIQKVADLYGEYIDKQVGLEKAGLERGAKLRLAVLSNEKKRLELDFTSDVKEEAEKDRKQKEEVQKQKQEEKKKIKASKIVVLPVEEGVEEDSPQDAYNITEEEAAIWAAYGEVQEDEEYDEKEGYDEDRDIEDALGLGGY